MLEKLEELVKPVRAVDEEIQRQYTKISQRFHLDEGRRQYYAGLGLWLTSLIFSVGSREIIGEHETILRLSINSLDGGMNISGVLGVYDYDDFSDEKSIHPLDYITKKFNFCIRLPVFATGAGMVGGFCYDAYNWFRTGEPIKDFSFQQLQYGLGLLSLASSMYIKDSDPKLLKKDSLFKKAFDWARETIGSAVHQPAQVPVRVR